MVATAARGERPNIIMFLIDDQNPSSIAAFGGDTYTPNLDRMAEEGMKFTRAYVSSSVCTPSRYSFLTGRFAGNSHSKLYAEAVGGKENQGLPNFNVALERDKMNVGNVLREAGYTTGFVGKFHLTSQLDFPEFYKGKDRWINIPKDASPGPETSAQFKHNERWMRRYLKTLGFSWAKNVYPENMHQPYSEHNPEWTTVAALEFIEENKDGPFYLHLCSTLLHGPDRSWRKSMDHPLITGEGEVESLPEVMTPRAELLKTITEKGFDPDSHVAGEAWIDDSLGAIFRKLEELGIDDNTLVIFAPDHGRDGKASVFSHGSCSSAHDHALAKRNSPPGRCVKNSCRISTSCPLSSNWVKRRNRSLTGSMDRVSPLFSRTEQPKTGGIISISKWELRGQRSRKTGPTLPFATPKNRSLPSREPRRKTYPKPCPTLDVWASECEGPIAPASLTKINSTT